MKSSKRDLKMIASKPGMMWWQVQACQKPQEAGRDK
jgi:hypothetical protein